MRTQTRKRKTNGGAGDRGGAQTGKQSRQKIKPDEIVTFDHYILPCSKPEITMLSAYGSLK